jgi:hypothetical protein
MMVAKLITLGLALFALGYYIKSTWPGIKERPLTLTLMAVGMLGFVIGVILGQNNWGSHLRLLSTCVFFAGVAIDVNIRRKKNRR